jgi:hypothetical protein
MSEFRWFLRNSLEFCCYCNKTQMERLRFWLYFPVAWLKFWRSSNGY